MLLVKYFLTTKDTKEFTKDTKVKYIKAFASFVVILCDHVEKPSCSL